MLNKTMRNQNNKLRERTKAYTKGKVDFYAQDTNILGTRNFDFEGCNRDCHDGRLKEGLNERLIEHG